MKHIKYHKKRISMTMMFMMTLFIFVIMFLTMTIMGLIMFVVLSIKLHTLLPMPELWHPIPPLIIASTIVGTALASVTSRITLKPVGRLINAINELAAGNFSVRISLTGSDEITKLSDSFNRMAEELGNTEMLRSDFINNFSHEFKTPIVSLRGFAKLLKSPDLTQEERDEYLDIIISESGRLTQLSNNVLNLSKIENTSIVTDNIPFDLTEQIRQSILLLEPKWEKKRVEMIIDLDEVTYCGNQQLLNQVWINLIDNAVKFTPEKTKVKIKLRKSKDEVIFEVLDNGYGMDVETTAHIFDRFYQGDASHTAEGNGIGLTIVHKIVKLYGGTVSVKSEPGIGTNFIVMLPMPIS